MKTLPTNYKPYKTEGPELIIKTYNFDNFLKIISSFKTNLKILSN